MEKTKILVVDDEQDLCEILLFNLTVAGYEVDVAHSAEEATEMVHCKEGKIQDYALILLDVMMPGLSGFDFAKQLKADHRTSHIPVIFLTAKDTEDDTLQGFCLGADDYVTKPFSVREVVARTNAVLKRNPSQAKLLKFEGLVIDQSSKAVTINNNAVELTRTEFDLLTLLLSHRGQVFSRQELLDKVWSNDVIVTERTVDVNINRLRKKLGDYASCILTKLGFGYYCCE